MILDEVLKHKYLTAYSAVKSIKNGEMPPPRMLILYPTNRCNMNCVYCDYAELNAMDSVDIPTDKCIEAIWEFADMGGASMELCGGGEPLLHRDVNMFLDNAHSMGLTTGVLTNGSPLWHVDVFDCSYLRISYDAGTGAWFKKIKRSTKEMFRRIQDHARFLISVKPDTLKVSYKYTISNDVNLLDLLRAYKISLRDGYDSFQVRLARNVEAQLPPNRIEKIKRIFRKKRKRMFFSFSEKLPKDVGCFVNPLQVVVDYNLDVWACCYYRHRMDSHRLGNLRENTLREIWYSDRHWDVIRNINVDDCNKYDCRFIDWNIKWDKLLKDGQMDSV